MKSVLHGLTATSAAVLLMVGAAQADVTQTKAGNDQNTIAVQDSLNGNDVAILSGNLSDNTVNSNSNNNTSVNDSQTALFGSQAAGRDANLLSHNSLSADVDTSVNGSQFAEKDGIAAGGNATHFDADDGSQIVGGTAYMRSHNDESFTVEIGGVSINLTGIASRQKLEATVSDNEMRVSGAVLTGNLYGGAGNFKSFSGVNSQNANTGLLAAGLNANVVNVHGAVAIK
jgi:hypothetical protein